MSSSARRQSGLWTRNSDTGFYEQVPLPKAQIMPAGPYQPQISPAGPYDYYQPPPRAAPSQSQSHGQHGGKRSFSDRSGMLSANAGVAETNGAGRESGRKGRGRSNTLDAVKDAGHKMHEAVKDLVDRHPQTASDDLAKTQHVNSPGLPEDSTQPSLRVDPDSVPANVRSTAWSPDPMSPRTTQPQTQSQSQSQASAKQRQASNASNVSETLRRGSVPDRSPLQSLESWGKEEKRARVAQAEEKARQKSTSGQMGDPDLGRPLGSLRSEKGRVLSDGSARSNSTRERRRNVSDSQAENGAQRFHHASTALRSDALPQSPRERKTAASANQSKAYERHPEPANQSAADAPPRESTDIGRSESRKYRARNAGFAGGAAAAAAAPAIFDHDGAAERGQPAYERRTSHIDSQRDRSPVSPLSQESPGGVDIRGSKTLQKRPADERGGRNQSHADRMGGVSGSRRNRQAAEAALPPDPVPRATAESSNPEEGVRYAVPPLTANAQQAKTHVGFADAAPLHAEKKHHRLGDILHRGHDHRAYQSVKPLEEWRQAKPAHLTAEDGDLEHAFARAKQGPDGPWWEKGARRSSSSSTHAPPDLGQYDGPYEETANGFQPRLFLKCGPLLRYTGIRRETVPVARASGERGQSGQGGTGEKEIWRGSVMIVTEDDQSDLASTPTLRLFAQPMDLHTPPPPHLLESGQELPPEFEDPVAGQVKLSRTGRALYVRPVADIDGDVDLSREENNQGLYSAQRTPVLGPQASVGTDGRQTQHITFQDKSRIKGRDGERAGRYRETKAVRLHTERGYTFWRFNLEIELSSRQTRVAYRINKGPAVGFWVPARGETMNIMFHSCNGFSMSVDSHSFCGPDPLWRDVLNRHQARPFHVMIGGGDQIYNDAVMRETTLFRQWGQIKNPQHKHETDFTPEMQEELEQFYLHRYSMWFSQGLFGMANSQIPMVNIWDDHDIIDGYGSYPHHFMATRVFTGLGAIAFKYYMLFQHQSVAGETQKEEPSWLLGHSPGPYIGELSRNIFLSLGRNVSFLGLDCRTERMRDEVLSQETYDAVFDRCRQEIVKGDTKHLIVLLGVPIAYPRLNFLENILTSRVMDPIKAIGRTGMLGGFVNKVDGGVEILDDLDDHWTAKHHKAERNWFIQELQELAAEKSVRVTMLGGDVHLGAVGQFFSNKKLGIPKDRDHRYMPNVISSAIVNTPPPAMMADVLNKRNKIHHLDPTTDEDMIPMFSHDVDRSRRNNNHLLPRRNFCVIREYVPGSTPPGSPVRERPSFSSPQQYDGLLDSPNLQSRKTRSRFPPGSMRRTMSLTRGPANLVRRLSGSSKKGPPPISLQPEQMKPYNDEDRRPTGGMQRSTSLSAAEGRGYFPPGATSSPQEETRPTFRRRPTNFSEKDARKASITATKNGQLDGAAGVDDPTQLGHIDLQGGLDISLCVEVDQHDPTGTTMPYRLLVPALWYEGPVDTNLARFSSHRKSLMDWLRLNRKREAYMDGADDEHGSEASRSPRPLPAEKFDPTTERNTAVNSKFNSPPIGIPSAAEGLGLTSTGRGAIRDGSRVDRDGTYEGDGGILNRGLSTKESRTHGNHGADAYSQGYNLSSPPIGAAHQQQQPPRSAGLPEDNRGSNDGYPQSGYRRASAPVSQPQPQQQQRGQQQPQLKPQYRDSGPYGRHPNEYPDDDDASYTASNPSDDDGYTDDGREPPARKFSNVNRFFGIGGGGGRQSMDQGGRPKQGGLAGAGKMGSLKGKGPGGWKIWKKSGRGDFESGQMPREV